MSIKIAIVGEAYGADEELYKRPFVGPAGQELNRLLADAGILREECFITNCFNFRPEQNDISTLCASRASGEAIVSGQPLVRGLYLLRKYLPEIDRLHNELTSVKPNIVVALGNTAAWALTGGSLISKIRGAVCYSTLIPGLKCLPTYHPAAILRQYELRHVIILDLIKAKAESEFPEIRRPLREIWLEPDLGDCQRFYSRYIRESRCMAVDIETASGQITCIGFAPDITHALVVPFVDFRKPGNNYWGSVDAELAAWDFVEWILHSGIPVVGQNYNYDSQYLWMKYGVTTPSWMDDTMLLHHALYPESQKSLDFLGSVYTNELAWKTMRPRGKHSLKREE